MQNQTLGGVSVYVILVIYFHVDKGIFKPFIELKRSFYLLNTTNKVTNSYLKCFSYLLKLQNFTALRYFHFKASKVLAGQVYKLLSWQIKRLY